MQFTVTINDDDQLLGLKFVLQATNEQLVQEKKAPLSLEEYAQLLFARWCDDYAARANAELDRRIKEQFVKLPPVTKDALLAQLNVEPIIKDTKRVK